MIRRKGFHYFRRKTLDYKIIIIDHTFILVFKLIWQ